MAITASPTGTAKGDVHMVTFDGLHYDFQATGDFVLARGTDPGSTYQIQIHTSTLRGIAGISYTTQIAAELGDGQRVNFVAAGGPEIWVDGRPDTTPGIGTSQTLADGSTLFRVSADTYKLTWQGQGPNITHCVICDHMFSFENATKGQHLITDRLSSRRRFVLSMVGSAAFRPWGSRAEQGPAVRGDDTSFARVKSDGLIFGTTNDQPFDFVDTRTHQTAGLDADMLGAMLVKLGIARTQMKQVDNEEIIGSLLAHRMDMIADALYITEKRKQVVAFSDGWYKYGEVLLVRKGNPLGLHSLADVDRGARVGAGLGTVYLDWAKALSGAKVSGYPAAADVLLDLKIGRLDAAILDAPVAGYVMRMNPQYDAAFEIASNYTPKEIGTIGAAFRKEDATLREAFNWALASIKRDGTDLNILLKWGLSAANRVPI